jgi:tetratricopeptide (TPR) repeat protein
MSFRNKQHTPSFYSSRRKFITSATQGASSTIRDAERLIAAEQYDQALQRLDSVKEVYPQNKYILAIIDRISHLKAAKEKASQESGNRYLEVTVGSQFTAGVRDQTRPLPSEIDRLTHNAESYLKQGLLNKAFEVLMQAYLLDPLHPAVISCEEQILPSWERERDSRM